MVPDSIERETVIDAPIERVWALLTDADELAHWSGDAGVEIDPRPGGAFVMHWIEHGTVRARIERIEPMRLFSYRWGREDPAESADTTLVEYTLAPEGDGTRLRVVESGFSTLDLSEDERAAKRDGNVEGWQIVFDEIRKQARRVSA